MKIKVWRDPYDCGVNITRKKEIDFPTRLTILVGCNGAGKSTLIMNIREYCKENKIPCIHYDNLSDGGHNALSSMFYFGNSSEGALLLSSSEGECVKLNASRFLNDLGDFVKDGFKESFGSRLYKALGYDESEGLNKDIRVILLDAVDSGLSIDSLVELNEALDELNADLRKTGLEYYLIVTANEYELSSTHRCLDVESGNFRYFNNYNQYRKFILSSRKRKHERIDRMRKHLEKRKQSELKEYKKLVKSVDLKRKKILSKYPDGTDPENMISRDKYNLKDLDYQLTHFINYEAHYLKEDDVKNLTSE